MKKCKLSYSACYPKKGLLNRETLSNLGGGVCHDLHEPLHPRLALPVDKQRQDVRHVGAVYGVEQGLPLHRVQFRRFFRVSILVDKLQTRNKGISSFTGWLVRMSHRKWRETNMQPRRAKSGHHISC